MTNEQYCNIQFKLRNTHSQIEISKCTTRGNQFLIEKQLDGDRNHVISIRWTIKLSLYIVIYFIRNPSVVDWLMRSNLKGIKWWYCFSLFCFRDKQMANIGSNQKRICTNSVDVFSSSFPFICCWVVLSLHCLRWFQKSWNSENSCQFSDLLSNFAANRSAIHSQLSFLISNSFRFGSN